MKIALLIKEWDPEGGGAERQAGYLAGQLNLRGHEVHVFAARGTSSPEGVVLHPIRARSFLPGGRHVSYARAAARAVRASEFDVVHSFTRTLQHDILRLGGGVHREYLERRRGDRSPWGRFFSSLNPKEKAILRLEEEGLRPGRYRKVVALSRRGKAELLRHYEIPSEDVVVIYNGVDTSRFRPDLRQTVRPQVRRELAVEGEFVYLFSGRGFARKGLRHAISALHRLRGGVLLVTGDAKADGSSNRIRYLGYRRDMERVYAAADALVLPTLYDPFSNSCLEAMACGTPVITTEANGASGIMSHGEDGYVIPIGADVDALSGVMRAVREADAMGKAAANRAREFSLERNVEANLRLYEEVLRSKEG